MSLFKKLGKWAARRATEGSTMVGVALPVVTSVIAPIVAAKLGLSVEEVMPVLTKVSLGIGGILIGATSRNHPPISEQV
jgi:VIT1/CCC1 family predicted Fe2+/Mn2+ transporter